MHKPILNPFTINSAITRVSDEALDSFEVEAKGSSESRQEAEKLVQLLSRMTHDLQGHLNSVNIATILHRTARLAEVSGHKSWVAHDKYKLIQRLLFLLASCPGDLDPSVLSMIIWSMAKFGQMIKKSNVSRSQSVATFLKGLVNQAKQKPLEFSCRDSTVLLQGLYGLQVHPGMPFVESLAENAKKTIEHASTDSLTRMPWWLVNLQYSDYNIGLFPIASREVETRVHANNVSMEEAGIFLAALARCEVDNSLGLCSAMELKMMDAIRGHRIKDVVRLVEGFALLRYRPSSQFINAVSSNAMNIGEKINYQYLIQLLRNYAMFGLKCERLVSAVVVKLHESKNMTPNYVCMACSALAQLDELDIKTWKCIIGRIKSCRYLPDSALRMLYQGWLHLSCETDPAGTCGRHLLTACRGSWKKEGMRTGSSFIVKDAISILTDSGFQISENDERTADLDVVLIVLNDGSKCVLHEVSAGLCFINHPNKLKGDVSWKVKLVRKLGWKICWLDLAMWDSMETKAEKLDYLIATLGKDQSSGA